MVPDKHRLVLIQSVLQGDNGDKYLIGTGYFIKSDLILTARHVLSEGIPQRIRIRVEEGAPLWRDADPIPVWENKAIDAAVIKVNDPIDGIELPDWLETPPETDVKWQSTAYPTAYKQKDDTGLERKTAGLSGIWYVQGGGGQGMPELDLGVDDEAAVEGWHGVSGAPVFVENKFIGIIKSTSKLFRGNRLLGVPIAQILNDPGFLTLITAKFIQIPEEKLWFLLLNSENGNEDIESIVRTSLFNNWESIQIAANIEQSFKDNVLVTVNLTEVLENPQHWYESVHAICHAPFMIADVTDFQIGIMLFLGIRAVVRRGVTLSIASGAITESQYSSLPFNIQETKLICLTGELDINHPMHPVNRIGSAIIKGILQLDKNPKYLDLPAYDAVRCPKPDPLDTPGKTTSLDTALVLCPFNEDYTQNNWKYLSDRIFFTQPGIRPVRMLDLESPRLVGQALYEQIRWAPYCIVDWSFWRPNVFFELGVRLACSDIGPICFIEENHISSDLSQKARLIDLLNPTAYQIGGSSQPIRAAFKKYALFRERKSTGDLKSLSDDFTYQIILNNYDWTQETITQPPHKELLSSIELQVGTDYQRTGDFTLFSSNRNFSRQLRENIQKRWLAAWLYVKNQVSIEQLKSDESLKGEVISLGENVLLALSSDSKYQKMLKDITKLIEDLELVAEKKHIKNLIDEIIIFKTKAKNRRDQGFYDSAVSYINKAIEMSENEFSATQAQNWRSRYALELSDCYGIKGGILRRWGLESEDNQDRKGYLLDSVIAYDQGFFYESNDDFGINNSYNKINRLVSRILYDPELLSRTKQLTEIETVNVISELDDVRKSLEEQLRINRRDDIWALADYALVNLLLDRDEPHTIYSDFIDANPPGYAYASAISTLKPLSECELPISDKLQESVDLLEKYRSLT